jgi:pimeloyl-ACP methyl ester carboxylesterase
MTTFVLIPGAGGAAVYWNRVVPLLERDGFEAIAVEFPADDDNAGLPEYCARTLEAIGAREDVILVAQSLGGFTAPMVASRSRAVRALAFVNAMIPKPGETAGAWWGNTGSEEARAEAAKHGGWSTKFDLHEYFLHDVPEDVAREIERDSRPQTKAVFTNACAIVQHRVAKERLGEGVAIEDLPGGHLVALSYPKELAEKLVGFAKSRNT